MGMRHDSFRGLLGRLAVGAALWAGVVQGSLAAPPEDAKAFIAGALQNRRVSYEADRTSCFWTENGTHALVAHVSKEGTRTRYDYSARGTHPAQTVIETDKAYYFVRPGAQYISEARHAGDTDIDGIRVNLALKNYEWRFQALKSTRRRLVSATRPGDVYPTQRFWVAVPEMVVVRSERYGPRGELRASWALSDLHFKPDLPDSLFVPTDDPTIVIHPMSVPVRLDVGGTQPTLGFAPAPFPAASLPQGYQLVDRFVEQVRGAASLRMVYSDGLNSFSLLESGRRIHRPASPEPRRPDDTSGRDVQIFDTTVHVMPSTSATVVQWQDSDRFYAIMGTLPDGLLISLARGLIASVHPPELAPPPPPPPTFGQTVARGWQRLLKWLGLA